MDAYEAIMTRKTVRNFQKRKPDRDTVIRIIKAGLKAPSNNHLREWEFIIMDDEPRRIALLEKIPKNFSREQVETWLDSWNSSDPLQRNCYLDAVPKQYAMLLTAGCLILPFFRQDYPLLNPSKINDLNGFASIWCCIENMLITASAEGLYGVVRIPFPDEIPHIKEITGCPDNYEIPCYLALGYPEKNAAEVKQPDIKAEDHIHWNGKFHG